MGGDSDCGVVDSNGKCFNTDNLYVADGSIVPTSLGVNPQITIMALATKISHHIADELKKAKVNSKLLRKIYVLQKKYTNGYTYIGFGYCLL